MLIQGGKSNDGNVTGLDLSTVRASNGTAMYSVTNGVKTDYIAEPTQKDGGILLASGNYANPVSSSSSTYVSDDAPPESYQRSGQRWWVPSEGLAYIWYEDGDSGQWVQENNATAPMPSHNDTLDRNAVGAHDDVYVRTVTLAEAIAEDAPVGTRYVITDRAGKVHIVKDATANGIDIHSMTNGLSIALEQGSRVYMPEAYGVVYGDFSTDYTANMDRIFNVMDGVGGTIYLGGFINAVLNPSFNQPTSVKLIGDTFRYGGVRLPSGRSEYAIDFDNDSNARLSGENFIVDGNRGGSPNGGGIAIRRQYVESFDHVGTLETGTLGGWLLEASNNNTLDSCYSIRSDGKGFDTIRGKAGTSNPESRCINNTFTSCDAEDLTSTAFDLSNARSCILVTPWIEYREVFQGTKPTNLGGQTAIIVNDLGNTIISPTIRGTTSANKMKTMIELGSGSLSTTIINMPHNNGLASSYALHNKATNSNSNIHCYASFNINSNAVLGSDFYNENSDDTILIHRGKEFSEIRTSRIRAPSGAGLSLEGFGSNPLSFSTGGVERFNMSGYTLTSKGSCVIKNNLDDQTITFSAGSSSSSSTGGGIILRGATATSNAGEVELSPTPGSTVVVSNLPVSASGLRAGSLYKEGGFLKIV